MAARKRTVRAGICCLGMQTQIDKQCSAHQPEDCPDALIYRSADGTRYGIRVHDGGSSHIGIKFCPWCAKALKA